MQDINDRNPCAFSPWPYAIGIYFFPQQIGQLAYIRELFRKDSDVEEGTIRYAPYYALGSVCIGLWAFFWVRHMSPRHLERLTSGYFTRTLTISWDPTSR